MKLDPKRIKALSSEVKAIGKVTPSSSKKKELVPVFYNEVKPDTPGDILTKINAIEGGIKPSAIEDYLKVVNEFRNGIKNLEMNGVGGMNVSKDGKNTPLGKGMGDLRWHGGGMTEIFHDTTLTGLGTLASPLSVASSGGGETLAQTLALGNITSAHNIIMSSGDVIKSPSATGTSLILDDSSAGITTDNGVYGTPYLTLDASKISLNALGTGGIDMFVGSIQISHGTLIQFNFAPVRFNALTASTVPYLDASKNLTSSAVTPTQLSYLDATSSIQTQLNSKGVGTVTSVSVSTANGVSGSVATATSTPAITLTLGAITPTTVNGLTITGNGTNTLNIAAGKSLIVSNILTLAGTDSTTMTFPSTSATLARTDAGNTFTGVSTGSAWVLTSPTITTKLNPTSDDGAPLGDTTHNWSDLFLASGAVVNYANSNVVLTHTSGVLTLGTGNFIITTAGTAAGSVATISGTQTVTNKRITKRVLALSADSATPAINTDNYDVVHITAQTAAITSFTSSLTGAPVDGDTLRISITGTAAVALTWGASFEASTLALPTTTVTTARLDVGFFWNTETTKWRCVAAA